MMLQSFRLLLAFILWRSGTAFVPRAFAQRTILQLNQVNTPPPKGDGSGGFQPDEEFNLDDKGGSVDWDAEWKKVVQEQKSGKSVERPGEGYYKSEAEIAAIRAANKATRQINRAADNMPSMPTWSSLQGDWKFWVGLLLVISVGTSLLAAQAPMADPSSGISGEGSYYI